MEKQKVITDIFLSTSLLFVKTSSYNLAIKYMVVECALGKITLYEYTTCVLFNSSVTTSFVSEVFARACNLLGKSLPYAVVVSIFDGSTVTCT